MNIKNHGIATGTIVPNAKGSKEAIKAFNFNSDGSQRIALSLSVGDNYLSRFTEAEVAAMPENVKSARRLQKGNDGVWRGYKTQVLSFEAYLPAGDRGMTARNRYNKLNPGDLVTIAYSVKATSYTDQKSGEVVYKQWLEIDDISTLRKVSVAGETAPAAAAAPEADGGVAAENDPF